MSWHKSLKSLNEIPDGNYQGYIWISDKETPQKITIIDVKKYENNQNNIPENPFIREGFLYDEENEISISITHIPDKYMINMFQLKQIPQNCEIKDRTFLAHKNLHGKLCFRDIWLPEKDEICENFEVLQKMAVVFTGFEKEEY